ncbi:MAG: hypothetical protein COB58_10640 [Thalassobium sp.]|nr:MAG: hypothetical protein COB58_14565 [Thalassobium sp.]PHQ84524.1 MAG: hypothetical protein COB58_10640 [Thalassobium sp.]
MLRSTFLFSALAFTAMSFAGYNNNISGVVSQVLTYPSGNVFVKLENQPSSHPFCNSGFFAIDPAANEAAIGRMYARILASYTTQQSINIGYDDGRAGSDCISGYIHIYRAG